MYSISCSVMDFIVDILGSDYNYLSPRVKTCLFIIDSNVIVLFL